MGGARPLEAPPGLSQPLITSFETEADLVSLLQPLLEFTGSASSAFFKVLPDLLPNFVIEVGRAAALRDAVQQCLHAAILKGFGHTWMRERARPTPSMKSGNPPWNRR